MLLSPRKLARLLPLALLSLSTPLSAALVSGPMLGHIEMREATVWVQTDAPSFVRVAYTEESNQGKQHWSLLVETNNAQQNTATLILDQVEPGTRYSYRVELNGELVSKANTFTTPAYFKGRTPPPDLRIAVGGAHYAVEDGFEPPYQILGGGYGIFSTIMEAKPELMLWLGNTAHLRDSDWASNSGTLKRFTKARAIPELQPLLANVPNYATWAAADYGPENAGRHYSFRQQVEGNFKAFWPQPVEVSTLDGIATRFRRSDVDFFILDVRSYRDDVPSVTKSPTILGDEQLEWLRQEIVRSTATFKVIVAGAPILNPAEKRDNLSYAEGEHTRLLQTLRDERIAGLFFLSGGKYYGELTRLVHANSYNLYDLTVGPLTANPKDNADELNFFRMPGSSVFERHFALLDFTGPEEDRLLTLRVMSMEGKELWSRTVKASQLQPSE